MSKPEDPTDMAARLWPEHWDIVARRAIVARDLEVSALITAALDSPDAFELLRALAEDLRERGGGGK